MAPRLIAHYALLPLPEGSLGACLAEKSLAEPILPATRPQRTQGSESSGTRDKARD